MVDLSRIKPIPPSPGEKLRREYEVLRRRWAVAVTCWVVFVSILWVLAVTSSFSAFIAVPVCALTGVLIGVSFEKMQRAKDLRAEAERLRDQIRFVDLRHREDR